MGCNKLMKNIYYSQLYCKDCMKKRKPLYNKKYRKNNKDKIKIVKGFLICKICGKRVKRITYRQRMCEDCAKKRRDVVYTKNQERMKLRKGKTLEELYGKERAKEMFDIKIKGIRSKNITCKRCGKEVKRTATRQLYCKECSKIRDNLSKAKWAKNNKQYTINYRKNYRIKNKKSIKEKAKIYKRNNKEKVKKQARILGREYYERNKEKIAKKNKLNKDKRNKSRRIYRKNNPIKTRQMKWKRRARENSIIHDFSNKEWLQKLKNTFGVCPKCNKYVGIWKLTLDHIYPISRAYKDYLKTGVKRIYTIDDVQPLCRGCNGGKRDKVER